jgi:hypothetical protein
VKSAKKMRMPASVAVNVVKHLVKV